MIQCANVKCKQSPVYGVFDRYFYIPLPIVTKHELVLFPQEPTHKIWYKSFHNFVIIVRGHRQTHRQTHTETHKPTPVKTHSLAFAGLMSSYLLMAFPLFWTLCCSFAVHWQHTSRFAGAPYPQNWTHQFCFNNNLTQLATFAWS